jgi:hypothetical protein
MSDETSRVEKDTKRDPESIGSHRAHRSQPIQRLALRHSSAAYVMTNDDLKIEHEDMETSSNASSGGKST